MPNPYYQDPYKKPETGPEGIPPFAQDEPGVIRTPSTLKGKPAGEVKPPKPEVTKELLESQTPSAGTRAAWCGMDDDGWTVRK